MTLLVIYIILTVGISFLCSILEATLLSITPSFIESFSKQNEKAGKLVKLLKEEIDKSISSILVLNTFANTMGAAAVGAQALLVFGVEMQAIVAVGLTLVILYFSEIIPKTIGATHWKALIVPASYTIYFMTKITFPLVWISSFITRFLKNGEREAISREEILAVAEMGEKEGTLRSKESDLIENLLKLKNYRAKDILTPRSVVFAFEANTKIKDAIEMDEMYLHSRIPVYKDSLDNVVGLTFNQTILEESIEGHNESTVESVCVPMFSVSENIPVLNLIDMFVKRKEHLFLVHDSFGQTAGVVSLEDAIETLLGVEIVDEMDEVVDMQQFAKEKARFLRNKMEKSNQTEQGR